MKNDTVSGPGISLVVRQVSKSLSLGSPGDAAGDSIQILNDINFKINAGESCAIIGASGSGKTTLLGILAGMDQPDSGEVLIGREGELPQSIYQQDEDWRAALRGREMGFVFQNFQLIADMTALDNVRLPLELSSGQSGRKLPVHKLAQQWLEKVGLAERQHHYPRQLSGGEQQRVALARAFANSPGILFADEPTGSLDESTGSSMIDLLFELNRDAGSTMVLVTHDSELASRCDSVYRLSQQSLQRVENQSKAALSSTSSSTTSSTTSSTSQGQAKLTGVEAAAANDTSQ